MASAAAQVAFSAKSLRSPPPRRRKSTRDREYLRPDEVEALMRAARQLGRHGDRDASIILLMFRHGLRSAELVSLRWQQVDLRRGYIDIHRAKRGHNSQHPLRGPQLRALRQLKRDYPNSAYVFVS